MPQGLRGAGSGIDRADDDKNGGNQRRGAKTNHFGADGGAKNIGGIAGAERPAEKQSGTQKKEEAQIHVRYLS